MIVVCLLIIILCFLFGNEFFFFEDSVRFGFEVGFKFVVFDLCFFIDMIVGIDDGVFNFCIELYD